MKTLKTLQRKFQRIRLSHRNRLTAAYPRRSDDAMISPEQVFQILKTGTIPPIPAPNLFRAHRLTINKSDPLLPCPT